MPDFNRTLIPFVPSDNNYTLQVPLGSKNYLFRTRWNSTDVAWYFDLLEEDGTPIALSVKVVLGVLLGRSSSHPFFGTHLLRAIDTSNKNIEAGFDDLGARVVVMHINIGGGS